MKTFPPHRRTAPALATALLLVLAACNSKPTELTADDTDDQKAALATAKPVALPPSIATSKTYRCKDNAVLYVDWMSDKMSAMVRAKKDASPVTVRAATPGAEMTADGGYAVKGSGDAGSADIAVPGHPSQSCQA